MSAAMRSPSSSAMTFFSRRSPGCSTGARLRDLRRRHADATRLLHGPAFLREGSGLVRIGVEPHDPFGLAQGHLEHRIGEALAEPLHAARLLAEDLLHDARNGRPRAAR